jgi:hypothetical protein
MESKKEFLNIRIDRNKKIKLQDIAESKQESLSSVIESALDMYLTKDIAMENLMYAGLEKVRRNIDYVDKKLEVFFDFYYFSLASILAGLPDLKNLDEKEAGVVSKNALLRRDAMFDGFKKQRMKQASAFERLLTDYIEQVNER